MSGQAPCWVQGLGGWGAWAGAGLSLLFSWPAIASALVPGAHHVLWVWVLEWLQSSPLQKKPSPSLQGGHPRCRGLSRGEDVPDDRPLQPGSIASEQSWGASGRQPGARSPAHGGVNTPTPSPASQTTDARQQSLCWYHPAGAIILGKFALPLSGDNISVV